jgi:L-aminopeptidase/D-esterase-like protein
MFQQDSSTGTRIDFLVGHCTDNQNLTGCTVVLFERPAPTVVEVRGGAPGTRETSLLGPGDLVQAVDAILLTGGSAFGLAAADGVMRLLRERGRGVGTPAGPVPIVPTAVIYDLSEGNPVWPDARSGRMATQQVVNIDQVERGRVGVGIGATTGKILGGPGATPGGFGVGRVDIPNIGTVHALSVVNAAGIVQTDAESIDPRPNLLRETGFEQSLTATTLTIVVIDAPVDRRTLHRAAIAAHDGMARRIVPCHTMFDGDVAFAVALRSGDMDPAEAFMVCMATELAVERSIVNAVSTPIEAQTA